MKHKILTNRLILLSAFVISVLSFSGCSLFGEKEDDTTERIKNEASEANKEQPKQLVEFLNVAIWQKGFNSPSDVLYGYDKLIYVSDRSSNTVYQFDENGRQLGSFKKIINPTKMAMDRKGGLFVIGNDTLSSPGKVFTAIYYLNLHSTNQILSNSTPIDSKLVHPFFYNPAFTGNHKDETVDFVKFVGIATYSDNSFIVARQGPDNSNSRKSIGYDNTILVFDRNREYFGNLTNYLQPVGSGLKTINNPTALATYANPPQSNSITSSRDFLIGMNGAENFYKVQGVVAVDVQGEQIYDADNKFLTLDTDKASRFLFSFAKRNGIIQSRFLNPSDITVTNADNKQYIFVSDSQLDSVYQFTFSGYEGVASPNGPTERNVIVSFGGRPTSGNYSAYQLNHPEGIAFGNNRLYVADTGNKRVLVYKLSTDITGQ